MWTDKMLELWLALKNPGKIDSGLLADMILSFENTFYNLTTSERLDPRIAGLRREITCAEILSPKLAEIRRTIKLETGKVIH